MGRISMPTEYYIDESVSAAVESLLAEPSYSEFKPLRDHETRFLVAMVRKTNAEDEVRPTSGAPAVLRKISSADAVFLSGYNYKLYVDACRWEKANEQQQKAMLHEGLMHINVELKEQGVKYSVRKPDVETYQATVVRFGPWKEPLLLLRENLENAQKKAAELAQKKPVPKA